MLRRQKLLKKLVEILVEFNNKGIELIYPGNRSISIRTIELQFSSVCASIFA